MKLTPLQRRRTLARLASLYEKAQREHPNEQPMQHHARAFAWLGCEPEFSNFAARMRLNRPDRLAKWIDPTQSPKTWRQPKNGRPHARPEFPRLFDAQPPQQQQQPTKPPTVHVIGEIDGQGQTFQASPDAPPDGAQVLRLVNATIEGQSPPAIVIDPLQAGPQPGAPVDYTGEPMLRAALVDALRERRRGRDLRGLDTGELDLSRIGPTALGLDLDRAFARRIRPDVRGVAVLVLVDASSSMRLADRRGEAAKRGACLAYRALTRERIAVAVAQYGAPGLRQWADIVRFNAPQSQAMQALHNMPDWRHWGTDAPDAVGRAAAALAQRSEPRRVLMFLCDEDVDAPDAAWFKARAAGLEIWPILLGSLAARGRDRIDAAGWSSIPPIVAEYPAELVPTWTRAIREHLGRIAQ